MLRRGAINILNARRIAIQLRSFGTSRSCLAIATSRKSFNKTSQYDKSRQRKGSGSDKNFAGLIRSSNFKATAKDDAVMELLPTFNIVNLRLGDVVKYNSEVLRKMYISGSFKPWQYDEIYSQPVTLIRKKETSELLNFHAKCFKGTHSKTNRLLITGPSGIGKSTMLAQFHAMVFDDKKGAVLVSIPNAEAIVDGSSDFKYNAKTGLYDQQMLSKNLLHKFVNANSDVIGEIKLAEDFVPIYGNKKQQEELKLTKGKNTLLDLANLAFKKQTNATNTENKPIYFQKLQLAKTIVDYISGEASFANGGVIAATHGSDKHSINETLKVGLGLKQPDLYKKLKDFDRSLAEKMLENEGVKELRVGKFDIDECQSLLSHMMKCDVIHNEYQKEEEIERLGEEQYLQKLAERKYIVSGNGNPLLLIKSCILYYT
ncbi:hypothetical protein HII13_001583 [Brettanomyces bruxellensis]|nr:hypothetical protein HII13_001583 [Brettanomyces bruxellensis]